MQKKEWIPVGAALLLLAFGAVYDYQITDTLYQTLPMTGMIFERFLLLPVQMMTVLAMAMLFRVKKNAFYLVIGYAASYYMLQDALHYWVSLQNSGVQLLLLAGSGGLIAVVQLVIQRIPYNWIQKHLSFFVFYTLVLLSAVLITTILKLAWGRIAICRMPHSFVYGISHADRLAAIPFQAVTQQPLQPLCAGCNGKRIRMRNRPFGVIC